MFCKGCGIKLQNKDKEKLGFTPLKLEENIMCERCFKMKHYGTLINKNELSFKVDDSSLQKNITTFFIVNIINLYSLKTIIKKLESFENIELVVNKIDILPESINLNKIFRWIKINILDNKKIFSRIHFCSSYKGWGLEELFNRIFKEDEVNFIGFENAGKSSIINSFLKVGNVSSPFPGTTQKVIQIKIKNTLINDYPGFLNPNSYLNLLNSKDLKLLNQKKTISPKTFQLQGEQTVFFDKFGYISFVGKDISSNLVSYFPDTFALHRTPSTKIENILNSKDIFNYEYSIKKMKKYVFDLKTIKYGMVDFVVPGLGFFVVKNNRQKIIFCVEEGTNITAINSIFNTKKE